MEKEVEQLKKVTSSQENKQANFKKKIIEQQNKLKIEGFLTAGLSQSNRDRSYSQVGNDLTTLAKSKMGLQTTFAISSVSEAVIQMTAKAREDDWNLTTSWAYWSYEVTPQFTFRAGRMRAPAFLQSEVLDVGYSYPWVEPPSQAYASFPLSNFDGVDFGYQFGQGSWGGKFKMIFGESVGSFKGVIDLKLKDEFSAELFLYFPNIQVRFGHGFGKLDYEFAAAGIKSTEDGFFSSAGINYENKQWLVMAEFTRLKIESADIYDPNGFYITVGRQIEKFMPYITWGKVRTTDDGLRPRSSPEEISAALALGDTSKLLTTATADVMNTHETSINVGVRYDIQPGVDIKFQVEYIDKLKNSDGYFDDYFNAAGLPEVVDFDNATIMHLVVDAVF